MKVIKFFVAAMAMAFAMSANAQFLSDGRFTANVNLGSVATKGGFGLGFGYQKEFYSNDYVTLAWDVAQFEWNAPFNSPGDLDYLSLKTGIRAFSPSFANDKLRAYTNLSLGYTCVLAKTGWSSGKGLSTNNLLKAYGFDNIDAIVKKAGYSGLDELLKDLGYEDLEDYLEEVYGSVDDEYLESIEDDDYEGGSPKMKAHSAFGLTWGVGIQYNKKWSLGYTLQYETWGKSKNHFATISYTF